MQSNLRSLTLALLCLALLPATATARGPGDVEVFVTDDWPLDAFIDTGQIICPDGELILEGPFPACSGGQFHLRHAVGYGCFTGFRADGTPDPRLTGVARFTLEANLDASYAGAVWGRWMIVPSESCDPTVLDGDGPRWEGTWRGQRSMVCESEGCYWVGVLKMVGRGLGEGLSSLHFKGVETITTFTPIPLPYELIPGFCPVEGPCPPEGLINGHVWRAPGPHGREGNRGR
jgi:hypothetical protein